jgi:glycosyltransferase involved in cell wall biosynthesis
MKTESNNIVLSICDIHPLRLGSFEEYLIEMSRQLNINGFHHIIVFRKKPIPLVMDSFLSLENVDIHVLPSAKNKFIYYFKLYKFILKVNPYVVHFHFFPPFSFINYIKILTNAKLIYTDHMGLKPKKNAYMRQFRKVYYLIHFFLFSYPIDHIVCVSNFVKNKYTKDYGIRSNKLTVIHNGINFNRFSRYIDPKMLNEEYNFHPECIIISCIAGLRKDKGVQCFIMSAPLVLKSFPNAKFFIVGDGQYRRSLETIVDEMGLNDSFIFTGFESSTEKYYSASSCVVIPSLVDEAFCFVAAEAISAGCPVIAFNSGAINELFGDISSVHVIMKNSKDLSQATINLLSNRPTKKVLETNKNIILQKYSLEKSVNKHLMLYFD